jgi:signal transduction histidine kinase
MSAPPRVEGSNVPAGVLYELPVCILILNASGELQLATRRAEELLGLTFEEIAKAFRYPGSSQLGTALTSTIMSSGGTEPQRFELERADGLLTMIEGTATEVEGSTGLPALFIALEDVSARERRERAERDFVTNAAHELQTPLAAITSAVQVLQAGAKNNVADRDRFLNHAEDACDRLERLARALLVLARAQTGAERPRQEIIPVAALLSSIADGARGRKVDVECPSDVAVLANRPLLEQALANLCQNAVKHSHGPIVLVGARSEGFVQIEVRDSGGGIDQAHRERVFQRFYRGGADPGEGFGVGLSIVKEAVEAIEGELELDTSRSGTNVAIRLPGARIVSE